MLVGSQVARYNTAPSPRGYSLEHADLALELAKGYQFIPDPWQETVVRAWLRTEKSGEWCASTWAVSVARQNGKNGALEVVELYCMVVLNLKILHTSHLLGSARKAFKRLMHFFGSKVNDPHAKFPELNALVKEIRKTNGQEAIELHTGGLIELGARTGGAGRGSSFDILVVDEAQEFEEDEQEALEPTVSASPSGDPIIIYMGTPPRDISERGAPFVRVRNAAITKTDKRSAWVEHSAPGDVDKMDEKELQAHVADRRNWAEGNPALGTRLKVRTLEGEHHRWSARSYARERLNMWPTPNDGGLPAIKQDAWDARAIDDPDADWPVACYAVDMSNDRSKVSIGVAAFSGEASLHLELAADAAFSEEGVSAVVEWLWERCKRRIPVVIDGLSPAKDLLEVPLKAKKMKVFILGPQEYLQACAMITNAVEKEKSVTHFGQEHLDLSLRSTVQEPVKNKPGVVKWSYLDVESDISQARCVSSVHYGALKFGRRRSVESGPKKHAFG